MSADTAPRRKGLFYGWYIVFAGAGTNLIMTGFIIFGMGVFIGRFREEFGWSMAAIATGFSIRSLETGLLSPLVGGIQDKLGAKTTAIMGLLLIGAGLLIYAAVQNLAMYYGAAAVMALGQSLGGYSAFSLAVMRWFTKKRGTAMGILNAGHGASYVGPLVIAAGIAALGWRETLVVMAIVIPVLGIPMALVIRDNPESMGLLPDGAAQTDSDRAAAAAAGGHGPRRRSGGPGMEVKEALRTPAFYMLVLSAAAHGFAHSPWNTLQIPHLEANGFSLRGATTLLAVYGLSQIPMRFAVGLIGDKLGRRQVYTFSFICHGLGIIAFAFVSPDRLWLVPLYLIFFGIGHGGQHTMGMTVVADYFGTKRYATLRGLRQTLTMPMTILAPIYAGFMFDVSGSYRPAFVILGFIAMTAAVFQSLIRRPFFEQLPQQAPVGAPVSQANH